MLEILIEKDQLFSHLLLAQKGPKTIYKRYGIHLLFVMHYSRLDSEE